MSNHINIRVNEVVGYNKDTKEIYILIKLFEFANGLNKGAIGTTIIPLTEEQIESYNAIDYVIDRMETSGLFEGVAEGVTQELYDEFDNVEDIDVYSENDNEEEFLKLQSEYISTHIDDRLAKSKKEIAHNEILYNYGDFPFHNDCSGEVPTRYTKVLETAFDMVIDAYDCVSYGQIFNATIFNDKNFVSLNDERIEQIKNFEDIHK